MQKIPSDDGRLERIEGKVDQILDRVTRIEERQDNHGAKLESHSDQLIDHGRRLREVELQHAVVAATGAEKHKGLLARWAAIGAVLVTIVGAIASALIKTVLGSFS